MRDASNSETEGRPSRWPTVWALTAGTILGALVGGLVGDAAYEPDYSYGLHETRGSYVLVGSVIGAPIGTIIGFVLWRVSRSPARST